MKLGIILGLGFLSASPFAHADTNRPKDDQEKSRSPVKDSKLNAVLALIVFKSQQRGEHPDSQIIGISIRLSGPVNNQDHRETLGLKEGASFRRVVTSTVTLGMLSEIAEIPEVMQISAVTQMRPNPSFTVGN